MRCNTFLRNFIVSISIVQWGCACRYCLQWCSLLSYRDKTAWNSRFGALELLHELGSYPPIWIWLCLAIQTKIRLHISSYWMSMTTQSQKFSRHYPLWCMVLFSPQCSPIRFSSDKFFMMHTGQIPVNIYSLGRGTIYFQNEQKLHTHSFHLKRLNTFFLRWDRIKLS